MAYANKRGVDTYLWRSTKGYSIFCDSEFNLAAVGTLWPGPSRRVSHSTLETEPRTDAEGYPPICEIQCDRASPDPGESLRRRVPWKPITPIGTRLPLSEYL